MIWSKYFQNPTYMEMTRKTLLSEDLRPLILKFCMIKQGMKLLDVGCGTGCFTRYLAAGAENLKIVGIDNDALFIQQAQVAAQNKGMTDRLEFIVGDACGLPFSENSFDGVASHTFFTSIEDPKRALAEMMRVTRPGGMIISITAMSFVDQTWHRGYYPAQCTWHKELCQLEAKVWQMYQAINPLANYTGGIPSSEIPHFFAEAGLGNVCLYPIGKAFSLSNAAMAASDKQEYILGMYEAERQKLLNYLELEETGKYISSEECAQYLSLLLAKRDYLLQNIGENLIWEWQGGANVLVTGEVEKEKYIQKSDKNG
ncbi:class I SAM-dependent methyltransferase [Desulfotomaculum sp. 1211_IL3151]|uniref:class I SAM-dependent methyltransferase n=1 Tax=Desulfotomaculum sp. 1211_IL3151 TaxID=3084055 RepID=UPI002FD91EFE